MRALVAVLISLCAWSASAQVYGPGSNYGPASPAGLPIIGNAIAGQSGTFCGPGGQAATSVANNAVGCPAVPGTGPSASLYAAPFYSCTRNFYVATSGLDTNAGTSGSPWQTIQQADSSSRVAGDCINVAAGTYSGNLVLQHGGSAPTASGYVAYRCATLDGCHVLASTGGHLWGFNGANFVVVDGFEVDGNNALTAGGTADVCFGSDNATYTSGGAAHHLWLLNNLIHDCNLAGVDFNDREWYYVLHNSVYNNSKESGYQGSGIGFVVVQCIESGNSLCSNPATYAPTPGGTGTYTPSGMDTTYLAPFHNVVAYNIVYGNMIAANNPVGCGNHTDGNGIIMDTFTSDESTHSLVYGYQSLVADNITHGNGGRGVHVFRTSNVTVANNSSYADGVDTCLPAYYLGNFSQAGGSNDVWLSNIAYTVQTTGGNTNCSSGNQPYCGGRVTPFVAGASGAGQAPDTDSNNTYTHNITFAGSGVQLFNNDAGYYSSSNNLEATDPGLVNPSGGNYALTSVSSALSYAVSFTGNPSTSADAGSCARNFTTCP